MWGFVSSIGSSILDFGSKAITKAADWGAKAASTAWDFVTSEASGGLLKDAAGAALGAAAAYGAASLFSGGSAASTATPAIAEVPALPDGIMETGRGTEASEAVQQAEDKARAALAARRGRSSTILTGPTGLEDEEAPITRKQLLGA